MLWVLADNHQARDFYERQGGRLVGERLIQIGGTSLAECAYAWRPLTPNPLPAT